MRLSLRQRFWISHSLAVIVICWVLQWRWFASIHPTHGAPAPGRSYDGWYASGSYSGLWLLDVLFGIPYGLANSKGLWHPGPSWIGDYPYLSLVCYFIWPLIVILVLSTASVVIFSVLWGWRWWPYRMLAVVIPMALLAAILLVNGQLGIGEYSYWRYSFANW